MKDLVFQYQKGKMPWEWGCTYSNIFGFPILARRSSFVRLIRLVLLKCKNLKVIFISLLDFYYHIRTATLQNSKLHYNFSDKLHILNTNNIVKSCTLVLNNSKSWYKDTVQVCFTSLWGQKILTFLIQLLHKNYQHHSDNYCYCCTIVFEEKPAPN